MSFVSARARRRLGEISVGALIIGLAWLIQLAVLSKLSISSVLCSLPLAITIVWGQTFGSPLDAPTPDELRTSSFQTVVLRQLLSGSTSGLLIGAAFGSLYSTVLPVYPIAYPIIGWTAGYFSLRRFNQAAIFCLPIVLLLSFLAEAITAVHLLILGRPDVLDNLARIALPEAVVNSLIAPFIFFPMRGWYQFQKFRDMAAER